jgi:hypothetical protein
VSTYARAMGREFGIDAEISATVLGNAGLMPPVVPLEVQGVPGGDDEVLVVSILTPCRDDVASAIASAMPDVRYELRYINMNEAGRRPGIQYQ